MTEYRKPELAELGEATRVIQGSKSSPPESQPTQLAIVDCELQD
jgi:hypothetical protein